MSQEPIEVPEDKDEVLDDSVSPLMGEDIPEVELPEYDDDQFTDVSDVHLVLTEEDLAVHAQEDDANGDN